MAGASGQVEVEFPVNSLGRVKLAKIAVCVLMGLTGGRLMIGWLSRLIVGPDVKLIAIAPSDGLCAALYFGLTLSLLLAVMVFAGPRVLRQFKHCRLWLISVVVIALCGLLIGFAVVKLRLAYWQHHWAVLPNEKKCVMVAEVNMWLIPVTGTIVTAMYLGLVAMLKKPKNV